MYNKIKLLPIETNDGIVTKYGSIENNETPSVILLRGKGRVKAIEKQNSYETEVNLFKKNFEKEICYIIEKTKKYENDYLVYIELSSKNISHSRYSFVKYDIFLKPIVPKTMEQMKKSVINISKSINKSLISELKGYFQLKID